MGDPHLASMARTGSNFGRMSAKGRAGQNPMPETMESENGQTLLAGTVKMPRWKPMLILITLCSSDPN